VKAKDYGAPGYFCVSCDYFFRTPQQESKASEWGKCRITNHDIHEFEDQPCHSAFGRLVVVKSDAVDQDTRDLAEARRWVREQIESGASLPPHEVAYMVGIRAGRAQVGGSEDEGVAWLERRLKNMRDLVRSQESDLAKADAKIAALRKEFENIAEADWRKWDQEVRSADDFVAWAKSRARFALEKTL